MKIVSTLKRLAIVIAAAATLPAAEVSVFAAASLSDALQAVARTYETKSGDKLVFNFAASSVLARQIKEGAPADVFFSADDAKMDDLARASLLVSDSRRSLLRNTLVIVVNADRGVALAEPKDLLDASVRRLALAEPATVPAGIYARGWLEKIQLWSELQKKVVATENVRACLAAVESGNADAGIVYKTDALISKKVKVAYEIAEAEGPAISYPVAAIARAKHEDAAQKFLLYLRSDAAMTVFESYGFLRGR